MTEPKEDLTPENEPKATGNGQEEGAKVEDIGLVKAKAEAEQARQDLLYLRAEFENTKRRLVREQEQAIKFANEKVIESLVPVVDLLERAISSSTALKAKGDSEVSNFVVGVEMTHREFIQILSRFGVEFIGSAGEKFDPVRHEAISQQEVEDAKADSVLQVFQRGVMLQGRLVTPAKVVVGRAKS